MATHDVTGVDELDDIPAGREWGSELYRIATDQFERASGLLDLDPEFRTRLSEPPRSS
jgi:hypothetical protein